MKILAAVTLLLLEACGGNGDDRKDSELQSSYSVGGTVVGLAGTGLVLRNNGADDLRIAASGTFTFTTRLPSSASYDVTVFAQPSKPSQTCVVAAGTGNWSGSPVTTVAVSCTTNTYTVGGTVSGLQGAGLVLRNNGGDDLAVNGNGVFVFPGKVADGDSYEVTVSAQPTNPAQICTTTDAGGTVGDTDIAKVIVVCGSIGRFVYSFSAGPAFSSSQTYISAYAIDASTGALSEVPGSPFVDGYRSGFRVTPNSRFAYAYGRDNWIYGFAIDSVTGALSSVSGSAFPTPSSSSRSQARMVFDPSSRFLYAANIDGNVYGYAINAVSGALTPVPGSPIPTGADPGPAVVDTKGQFLYVPNLGSGNVSAYSINPVSGTLEPVAGSPFASESGPYGMVLTPDGKLAYVAYLATENVSAYSVDSISGALTALAVIPFPDDHGPPWFTPNSRFAYWASASEVPGTVYGWAKTVSGFAVDTATGALTPVPGSQHAICCVPSDVLLHPSGKFLYVPSGYTIPGTSRIYGFSIDGATGALEPLDGSPFFCCGLRTFGLTIDASGRLGFESFVDGVGFGTLSSFVIDAVTGKPSGGDSVAVGMGGGGAVIAY